MRRSYRGNAQATTLAGDVQVNDTGLTLANGDNYPDGSTGPFVLTLDLGQAGEEKVLATSRSGTAVTGLVRGYDGTVAARHSAGAPVAHTISAVDLDEANGHVNDTNDPHPQYLTQAEGSTLYTPISHVTATDPHAQYLTAARGDALFLTPAEGNAAYAPISLVTATDPYPQYLTAAEGDTAIAAAVLAGTSVTARTTLVQGSGWSLANGTLGLSPLTIFMDHFKHVFITGNLVNDGDYTPNGTNLIVNIPAIYRPANKHFFDVPVAAQNGAFAGILHLDLKVNGDLVAARTTVPTGTIAAGAPHAFNNCHWFAA